jgi:ribosomal protein S18 acetylase RimI-like enzyme
VAATLAPRQQTTGVDIVHTLRPGDVDLLRLPGLRSTAALREALSRYPERSVWIPETLEYLLLTPWRHRPEIAHVEELVGIRHSEALLRGAFERCVARGDELLLAIELESGRGPNRYERAGLVMLEEVITYEIDLAGTRLEVDRAIAVTPVAATDDKAVAVLNSIDNEAFPWLWRNSRQEFATYLRTPGVLVALVTVDGDPAAYFGTTFYTGWGHLDRIAVAPRYQSRGIGRKTLQAAVVAMRQRGARRLGLSTQRTNVRSQRLYERFGFRRTPALDYQLFGRWCRPEQQPGEPF